MNPQSYQLKSNESGLSFAYVKILATKRSLIFMCLLVFGTWVVGSSSMPHNFSFIVQGKLAGMERPGSYGKLRDDLEFLRMNGVHAIVSLTESPLEKAFIEEFGFKYLHLPIPDFTPPSGEQIEKFLSFYRKMEAEGLGTLVHCGAGLGRTGTMLACALVERGMGAEPAIDKVRTERPYSIETEEQEEAIRAFAALLAKRKKPGNLGSA